MSKIKLLIHEVFKVGKTSSGRDKKNGIALYLSVYLKESLGLSIDERTLVRYYDAYIAETKAEIGIDPYRLDKLSEYVGYKDFAEFSRTFIKTDENANSTTVKINVDGDEESLTEKLSKIIINITNEQHFKMPEFVKQNGLGIAGIVLVLAALMTSKGQGSKNGKDNSIGIQPLGFLMAAEPADERKCMYWDKNEYKPADCEDRNPRLDLRPIDFVALKHFKKITRKDTLTVDNALGVTWYSKFNGNVEFFTMDGVDPDNGKELRKSTPWIIFKYAGKQ